MMGKRPIETENTPLRNSLFRILRQRRMRDWRQTGDFTTQSKIRAKPPRCKEKATGQRNKGTKGDTAKNAKAAKQSRFRRAAEYFVNFVH